MVPVRLKFLLLAPTENVIVPFGLVHPWRTTSQMDKSYRESVIDAWPVWPGSRSMVVNPFRIDGGSIADAGWCK